MDSGELSMKRYILETPDTVRHNIACSEELTHKMTELYLKRMYRSIWLVACGSSCNAALCARYLMQKLLGVPVRVVTPFTFNHYEHDITERDFVVCISQSGCSTNTIESLQVCRRMGIPAVGLTGNIHSDFEKEADQVISFGLGGEKLDFVTKGVVTLSTFLMLFALHTAVRLGRLDEASAEEQKAQMRLAMENYESIVAGFDVFFQRNRKNLLSMEKAYLIGAGANYGTALEGAVKIGETVHILAVGYEVDEAIHGPQIQLTPNYNFIFIDPGDETAARIEQSYRAAKAISDRVYILSNNPLIQGDGVMRVPHQVDEMISPLYTLAFVQMMAYTVSETNSTWKQHPLMKEYKAILFGKSDTYQAYDCT
jgi:glucoselysine-6-phosphate deglycase